MFFAPSIGYYVVTRHADIESVFLDHESYSAGAAQLPLVKLEPETVKVLLAGATSMTPTMVSLDPPAHTRLRAPTMRAFTPGRVARMAPQIRSVVAQLLDAVDPAAPFDLVPALSFPLPATIIFIIAATPFPLRATSV